MGLNNEMVESYLEFHSDLTNSVLLKMLQVKSCKESKYEVLYKSCKEPKYEVLYKSCLELTQMMLGIGFVKG